MKKLGIIIFIIALGVGVVLSNVFSWGTFGFKSPISFSFPSFSKVKGSGNVASENRGVAGFDSIRVSGVYVVEVVAQKDFSVQVEADDNLLPLIETYVKGDTLRIRNKKRISTRNPIKIKVSAPNIESIRNSGVAKVTVTDINNESFQIRSSGASKIKVTGKTGELQMKLSGACKVDATELVSSDVKVRGSGASYAKVNVDGDLAARLSGASRVVYSGSPKNINKRTSGASSVRQVKQ